MFGIAWDNIELIHLGNERHRRGFRAGEISDADMLQGCQRELFELSVEPNDIEELADALNILFHYAVKHGWSPAQVEMAMVKKLSLRFPDFKVETYQQQSYSGRPDVEGNP